MPTAGADGSADYCRPGRPPGRRSSRLRSWECSIFSAKSFLHVDTFPRSTWVADVLRSGILFGGGERLRGESRVGGLVCALRRRAKCPCRMGGHHGFPIRRGPSRPSLSELPPCARAHAGLVGELMGCRDEFTRRSCGSLCLFGGMTRRD